MSQPTLFTATDQPPPLDHRTVWVTGGSRGIGAATVRA
jgi:NADP-dependent 3-hydroxy acid dehydrogenase YdfG